MSDTKSQTEHHHDPKHGHDDDHTHGHDHAHGHSHGAGHSHVPRGPENERRVKLALFLTGGFMFVEAAGGVISGSLALLADAAHMLTDTGALALSWLAIRFAQKPADKARTYGYGRAEIIAAFVNGLVMIALSGWIIYEAAIRIAEPVAVMGVPMLAIGVIGLIVNIISFRLLSGGESLNMRSAALHVMGDMLGSVAAIVAAGIILGTGWDPIDPILSVVVALLVLRSAYVIVRQSGHVLMEGTPEGIEPEEIAEDLKQAVPAVVDVHHLHAWAVTPERMMVTLHARLADGADATAALAAMKRAPADPVQCRSRHHPDRGSLPRRGW